MLSDRPCLTGTVTDASVSDSIHVDVKGTRYFINLATTFVGAVENKVALASLKDGMSVNIWPNSIYAEYASINYK